MLNHAVSLFDTAYREQLYTKLKAGYPSGFDLSQAYTVIQSSIQLGKLQGSDADRLRQSFINAFNNVEVTFGNIHTLRTILEEEVQKLQITNEQQKNKLTVGRRVFIDETRHTLGFYFSIRLF